MLARHLRLPHQLFCITDDVDSVPHGVKAIPMPKQHADSPRCRRRMSQFAKERVAEFGPRMLCLDLDIVIVDNITGIVNRREPIVCWRVGYANVYSGSFIMFDTGVLDGAWRAFNANPLSFPRATGEQNASDQAMVNHWIKSQRIPVAEWTEADGFVTWFGNGYEHKELHGMGPSRPHLPTGARVVVLGSADKPVMDEAKHEFVRQHWC